jgi:hypothetical protein
MVHNKRVSTDSFYFSAIDSKETKCGRKGENMNQIVEESGVAPKK